MSSAAAEPAVAVEGLVKRYGSRAVLDDVSLEVDRGELLALLGPNGAGKTTTVEILEGYRQADAGRVRVLGADPRTGGPALRARVGLMLQGGGGIDPRARPTEVVRLYARLHDGARDPDELLELVGLTGAAARTPFRRLSGGERQRLGLALALVGRPELLILDEPTAGMDPAAKASTRRLVRELRDAGTTVLLTTHDLADVERLADRVAVLHTGRIVALGAPDALAAGAVPRVSVRIAGGVSGEASARLAAAVRVAGSRVARDPDSGWVRVEGAAASPAVVAAVAAWASDEDLLIAELRTAGATLEERYLELTGEGPA